MLKRQADSENVLALAGSITAKKVTDQQFGARFEFVWRRGYWESSLLLGRCCGARAVENGQRGTVR